MAITQRGEDAIQTSGDQYTFSPSADEHPPFETEESGDFDDGSARNPGIDDSVSNLVLAKGSTPLVKVVEVVAMDGEFCQRFVRPGKASDRFESNFAKATPILFLHLCVGVITLQVTARHFGITSDVEEESEKLFTLDEVDAVALFVGEAKCFRDVVSLFVDIYPTDADLVMEKKFDNLWGNFPSPLRMCRRAGSLVFIWRRMLAS